MKKTGVILTVITSTIITSCYYDNFTVLNPDVTKASCDTSSTMSYANHIVPVLKASCTSNCHTPTTSGRDLSTWQKVNTEATSGRLVSCIVWDNPNVQKMPQGSTQKIAQCDITKIRNWVKAGAPNN